MRRRGQLDHESLEGAQVGRHALEDEIDLPREHPAFAHQGLRPHEGLEGEQVGLGLAAQVHHGEDGDLVAEQLLVEQRAIALDVARLFERPHPAQARRGRYADPVRQLDIGDAAVVLQLLEDPAVDGVEAGGHGGLRAAPPVGRVAGHSYRERLVRETLLRAA